MIFTLIYFLVLLEAMKITFSKCTTHHSPQNIKEDGAGSVTSYLATNLATTVREKSMSQFLNEMFSLSLPISYIENPIFRNFSSTYSVVSIKTLRETIFKLVEIVENKIRREMNETRDTIKHDGRTRNVTKLPRNLCIVHLKSFTDY